MGLGEVVEGSWNIDVLGGLMHDPSHLITYISTSNRSPIETCVEP